MDTKLTRQSLKRYVVEYSEGNKRQLDLIIQQLKHPKCKDAFMSEVLHALRKNVAVLNKHTFQPVISSVLTLTTWSRRSSSVISNYKSMITNLVSAHTNYLNDVLTSICEQFSLTDEEWLKGMNDDLNTKTYSQCSIHIHNLLQAVINTVPMLLKILPEILTTNFPYIYHKEPVKIYRYVQNLLQVATYCNNVTNHVYTTIIQKVTLLDVKAPRQILLDILQTHDDDEDDDIQFEIDDSDMRNKLPPESLVLDHVMCILFNHIKSICYTQEGELLWEDTRSLYLMLLSIFEKIILPTHQLCHVQFILFYIISFKQSLLDGYIDYLWKKIRDLSEHRIYRQYASCYIASLLSRHKHVNIRTAADCISLMCEWIHQYMKTARFNPNEYDIHHHGAFYSTCQAVFYILAFRQHEFLQIPDANQYFSSLGLQNIIYSHLNPLKVCLPVITRTFASFVRKHQLAMCDAVIERNSRQTLSINDTARGDNSHTQTVLDGYFPFDPYLLDKSGEIINLIYREFEGSVITEITRDGRDEEDYSDDEMMADNDNTLVRALNSDQDMFNKNSDKQTSEAIINTAMSVSPGFSYQTR